LTILLVRGKRRKILVADRVAADFVALGLQIIKIGPSHISRHPDERRVDVERADHAVLLEKLFALHLIGHTVIKGKRHL
jgi:hypothetical protein